MQNIDSRTLIGSLYFIPNLHSKQSVQFCISFCMKDCQDEILIKLEKTFIQFFTYCYFNPFPNKPWFLRVCSTNLLETLWEKEKLLLMSNFSFSCSVFLPFGELSTNFIEFEIVVCKPFQFGRH